MTIRDHWTECFVCINCGNAGSAQLSATDRFSWNARVEGVPDSFKAVKVAYGSDFYCSACNYRINL
jgi:hypothetical protein